MSVWKSDETLLSICILNFSFKNDFVWEEISNIRHSVSSPDETPRSSSKILRCASFFQLSSRCFIWWWNTASHVWYITSISKKVCAPVVHTMINTAGSRHSDSEDRAKQGTCNNDDDGSENVAKKKNLRIFKLYRVTLLGTKCRRLFLELNS